MATPAEVLEELDTSPEPVRIITAAALFDGHDAAIHLIRRLLQDRGADTAEANETLGFDADERVYLPAAEMLRQLGFQRVRLLTNNPEKVDGLKRLGVEVSERVAHSFPSNSHNDFYLATKARRFGHIL